MKQVIDASESKGIALGISLSCIEFNVSKLKKLLMTDLQLETCKL